MDELKIQVKERNKNETAGNFIDDYSPKIVKTISKNLFYQSSFEPLLLTKKP